MNKSTCVRWHSCYSSGGNHTPTSNTSINCYLGYSKQNILVSSDWNKTKLFGKQFRSNKNCSNVDESNMLTDLHIPTPYSQKLNANPYTIESRSLDGVRPSLFQVVEWSGCRVSTHKNNTHMLYFVRWGRQHITCKKQNVCWESWGTICNKVRFNSREWQFIHSRFLKV